MGATVSGRPALPAEVVAEEVRSRWGLAGELVPLPGEWDQNFRLDAEDRARYVVKVANAGVATAEIELQNAALEWLGARMTGGRVPAVVPARSGERLCRLSGPDGAEYRLRTLTWLEGEPLRSVESLGPVTAGELGELLGELDRSLEGFRHPAMDREIRWDLRRWHWMSRRTPRIRDLDRRERVEQLLLQVRGRATPLLEGLPAGVIHNDANDDNVLVGRDGEGGRTVSGLLDFGDLVRSWSAAEVAVAAVYASFYAADPLAILAALAAGYHGSRPLSDEEIAALFPLMLLRLCASVTTSAVAAEEDTDNEHRRVSDRQAWELLERLEKVGWEEAEERVRSALGREKRTGSPARAGGASLEELLEERRRLIGPSLSVSYATPLEIVRGRGQYLFDSRGRAYLDCVNNVCHVGHSHPRVVEALARQAAVLNTNTRYLHPLLTEYARRLTATLPEPLRVCYFVNSGSEANELGVRLARAATGRREVIVLDHAYHGNTQTLVELSPYKCEGPGGRGLAQWAHKAPMPDPYRGPHRGMGEVAGRAWAESVREICERLADEGRPPGLFLCEPILGCAGQVVLPDGYLREAFGHARAVGALCLADEVQTGLGRVGTHFWAFEAHGVVPDIVTAGKPIGNGHPLAAVVTTPEVARAFANGMEFFSTFGGNPVSMAVGLAVLDVIEEEGLQQRALRVGGYLVDGFRRLAERHRAIGDVRGSGLFLGVELVEDRESRAPATGLTARVVERALADGVLLSAEGPHHNVLKIKPPLVFGATDADLLLGAVDRALLEAERAGPISSGR